MHVSSSVSSARSWSRCPVVPAALLVAAFAGGCGGSSGSSGQSGITGQESLKPGGGTFFVDENGSGGRASLHLAQVLWGRLVDVHEIDVAGNRVEVPVFRDFVVEPGVLTNGASYVLDRNPVTQRERLTIQARKTGVVDTSAFDQLLAEANDALPAVTTKNTNSAPPFTSVPRNACVVLRFDDCLDDSAAGALNLFNTVQVVSGYPPSTPFAARVVFDPNHGATIRGAFHSTRVLVDMTTSEAESIALPVPQGVNPIGLPASLSASASANVALRIPSRVDVGSGQFQVLTNLAGVSLDDQQNGPVDSLAPTLDILRALRSGNPGDASNGFLTDVDRPRVVGGWPITVSDADPDPDPSSDAGFDFLLDFSFNTTCLNAPAVGDVLTIGTALLEVTEAAPLAGVGVNDLKARSAVFVGNPLTLTGPGLYQAPFLPSLAVPDGCWVSFLPEATTFPSDGVLTTAQVLLRFSEPMDPDTLSPFGDFLIVNGAGGAASTAISHNIIVGEVAPNSDLTLFSFSPKLPMRHVANDANDIKHLELDAPRDLAGNRLRHELPFIDFKIEPLEATQNNGAIVLRLDANDEYAPNGAGPDGLADLRGQFFFDSQQGSIFPRPVATTGWPGDRSNPVPRLMQAGFNTNLPLNPLGAKVQALWRYCDFGWNVRDETKYNLDIVGLSWSPNTGGVQADFFELFEIRLGHSRFLPDEAFGNTGLPPGTLFENNYLAGSNQKVVHNRVLGYAVNPSLRFNSTTNVVMMPYPLNLGTSTPDVTYTWRDTTILTLGADGGTPGSVQPPVPGPPGVPVTNEGAAGGPNFAAIRNVPSVGLPLLIEFKCFPSDSGLGINALDVALAGGSAGPAFRAFSAGGINNLGNPTPVQPDNAGTPAGIVTPGGLTAPVDSAYHIGQLDTVVRVSRVHSAWLDSGLAGTTTWQAPVLEPAAAAQPSGTSVQLDFRSATAFSGPSAATAPFNAALLTAYGNPATPNPPFSETSLSDWSTNIALANAKRYLQLRITFVNNTSAGVSPKLTALALPFTK